MQECNRKNRKAGMFSGFAIMSEGMDAVFSRFIGSAFIFVN
jgi:hypothetical protein